MLYAADNLKEPQRIMSCEIDLIVNLNLDFLSGSNLIYISRSRKFTRLGLS